MNTLMHWNPIREIETLQNGILNSFIPRRQAGTSDTELPAWVPPVDIVEDQMEYLVTVELPGICRDEVKLTVENDQLSLTGERKEQIGQEGRKYHRVERAHGSFYRMFALPQNADPSKVEANMADGLLTIRIAKREEALPRRINVHVK